jgi:predicted ATPase
MFTKIRLEKFQGFDQSANFSLKPLTLIFGPNASGKSSIIRSLLLMKQSIGWNTSIYSRTVSGFSFEGPDISLASFANVVYKHNDASELQIEVGVNDFGSMIVRSGIGTGAVSSYIESASVTFRLGIRPPLNSLELKVTLEECTEELKLHFEYSEGNLILSSWQGLEQLDSLKMPAWYVRQSDRSDEVISDIDWTLDVDLVKKKNATVSTWEEIANGLQFKLRNNFPSLRGVGKRASFETKKIRQLEDLFTSLEVAFSKHLREVRHVGPLRTISERLSYEAGLVDDEIDSAPTKYKAKPASEVVSDWLYTLTDKRYKFQPVEFYAEPVKFLGSLKSQILVDTKTSTPVTFADVGVGLSQVLPILQAMQLTRKKPIPTTLVIEQPELHLHPAMQANLADLFIEGVKGRSKLQIIAETHSESMLLRVQKRLREGKLDPSDVQILYVDGGGNENTVTEVPLDADDEFSMSLPLSFSELRLRDLL